MSQDARRPSPARPPGARRPHPARGRLRPSAPPPDVPPIEVTIDRIVGDGKGIGFHEGHTVFVPRTAPGDRVLATVRSKRGTVIQGEIARVIEPSPRRVEPPCPVFDRCGGCDFQQLAYDDQLAAKVEMIQDSLRRIARLDPVPDVPITPSPDQLAYRSRAEWQIDHREGGKVGYFAQGTHDVVDVEQCPILTPMLNTLLLTLRDDLAAGMVNRAVREYRGVEGDVGSALEPTGASRSRMVMRTVGGKLFRFDAACFFQTNIPVAEHMLERVLEIADVAREEPGIAVDLYCGVGLFTAHLAERFRRVIGVESDRATTKHATENTDAGEEHAVTRIVTVPVEGWLGENRSALGRIALLVFDPPRTGAGAQVIAGMLKLKPAHIAAVSCDPATFSRDIRGLMDGGYELMSVDAFDMFPQTHHVELVAHLQRSEDA